MFSWLRPKSPQEREQAALDKMLTEFRRETSYIDDKWLPEVRQSYAGKIADVWRDYLTSLAAKCTEHSVDKLSELSADARIEIGNVLAETMIAKHKLCRKLRTKTDPTPEYLDAMCGMYANKHVGSFVTAMSVDRPDLAKEYAGKLDGYLGSAPATKFEKFVAEQGAASGR